MTKRNSQPLPEVPEGWVLVGQSLFRPPFVPTLFQLKMAEKFAKRPEFSSLSEDEIARNIARLAMALSADWVVGEQEGDPQYVPVELFGDIKAVVVKQKQGENVVNNIQIMDNND